MDKATYDIYKSQVGESPSAKCREIIHLSFKAADDWHFVFWDEWEGALAGGFTMEPGSLSFFNQHENLLHTIKVHQVYVANQYRGSGFFRMFMDCIISAADMSGAFVYLCCRPYNLNMPTIRQPMEYVHWIAGEDHYMAMHKDTHYERDQALNLREAYMRFGFLPLAVDRTDVYGKFWQNQILCSNPKNCCDDVKEALGDRVDYGEQPNRPEQCLNRRERRKKANRQRKRRPPRNRRRCA